MFLPFFFRMSIWMVLAFLIAALPSTLAMAANKNSTQSARVIDTDGRVTFSQPDVDGWYTALSGQELHPGDSVRTGAHSRVSLLLADESLIKLKENSDFVLGEVAPSAGWTLLRDGKTSPPSIQSFFKMKKGGAWFLNKNRAVAITLKTPLGVIGVRGTELSVRLEGLDEESSLRVAALEGQAHVKNDQGELVVSNGEEAVARAGLAPTKRLLLHPEEAVQWTITVPSFFTPRDLAQGMDSTHVQSQAGWNHLDKGQFEQALAVFEKLSDSKPTNLLGHISVLIALQQFGQAKALLAEARVKHPEYTAFTLQKAWLDLMTGEIVRANQALVLFTEKNVDNHIGWQLRALTALALDHRDEMSNSAKKAIEQGSDSATSWIIQAYIHQAQFQLDRAEEAIQKALTLDPENVTALLTLAKLQFGSGRTPMALTSIERAAQLAPDDAEVSNLKGFILFSLRKVEDAIVAFERAAERDTALSEPHMGLGLSYMRQGDTARALEEITTAVLLDPRRALLRSYWAKMLYQIGRHDKALDVLNMAKILDSRDPTPELYQAIILKDLNRPTEAINAINKAIALNDNRAVYRSRFMLDGDLAVKNVDLSKLFNQLNLSPWAKNKAAASIRQDYTNASGHLFYAGTLAGEEGRSWARNTENLLARLFIPANVNSFNSFNDYTTFVEKPAVDLDLSATAGSQRTFNQEHIISGAVPKANFAYQLGYVTSDSDGWRKSHIDAARSFVGFAKWDGPEKGSLMLAASQTDSEQGNKSPRYEYNSVGDPRDQSESKSTRMEAGYHQHFAPGSDLLLHVVRMVNGADMKINQSMNAEDLGSLFQFPDPTWIGENNNALESQARFTQVQAEYIHKTQNHQLLFGTSYYHGNNQLKWNYGLSNLFVQDFPQPDLIFPLPEADQRRSSLTWFAQDIWQVLPSLVLEADAHFDRMETGNLSSRTTWALNRFSPRFGLVWTPKEKHTIRAAAFRSLLPFASDRIDPSDIAGIPIHRNGSPGSITEEAQLVWEYETGTGILSADLFYLDREYPERQNDESMIDWKSVMKGGEIVYNRLIGEGLGLSSRYRYQDVRYQQDRPSDRNDHQWRTGLKWVRSDGFSVGLEETFRYTDFRVRNQKNEKIWTTDMELAYEFPKKSGTLSFEVNNLFDEHFNWVTDTFIFQGKNPARELFLKLSLNF